MKKEGLMPEFDTVIKGGTVVDGTRLPRYRADLGIRDGRVARIGRINSSDGRRVLDAAGMIVAPGFVDLHTHFDAQIYWDPYCTPGGWHGVTTVMMGNCGFGFAPVRPEARERAMLMMTRNESIPFPTMKAGMPWDWVTFPEYMDSLDRLPKGVNCAMMVPMSPLMVWVMGLEGAKSGRRVTEAEIKEMQRLLAEGLDVGAFGWSAQRQGPQAIQSDYDGSPFPSDVAADDVYQAFCDVLKQRGEGVIEILPAAGFLNDIEPVDAVAGDPVEMMTARGRRFAEWLAEASGAALLYNVIPAIGGQPESQRESIKWLEDCNSRGLRIIGQSGSSFRAFLQYSLDNNLLADSSPPWKEALHGSTEEQLAKLADPALRERMVADEAKIAPLMALGDFGSLIITHVPDDHPELEAHVGRKLGDIASEMGKRPIEAMLELSIAGHLDVEFYTPFINAPVVIEDEKVTFDSDIVVQQMRSPFILPGPSDGGAHTKIQSCGQFGTDMLAWLRDEDKLDLEDAHWHLSYLPAQVVGLRDRGFLREGAPADIIVYDLDHLEVVPQDRAVRLRDFPGDEWRLVQRAEGLHYTLVNGEVTFDDQDATGVLPGRLLRHGSN
jgi:N-acyl-D-aspartate/D-glutamate deacylase